MHHRKYNRGWDCCLLLCKLVHVIVDVVAASTKDFAASMDVVVACMEYVVPNYTVAVKDVAFGTMSEVGTVAVDNVTVAVQLVVDIATATVVVGVIVVVVVVVAIVEGTTTPFRHLRYSTRTDSLLY